MPGGLQDNLGGLGQKPHIQDRARKPKPRPRGWRDSRLFPERTLPTYTGPYRVATMEIEVPAKNPRKISHIKRNGRHALQLETVLMTIYYPTYHHENFSRKEDRKSSRQLWLGRPRLEMASGYGKFAGVGKLAVPIFLPAMFTKLPAYRNGPIASHWAPSVDIADAGTTNVKYETGPRPEGASEHPVFPLIMFSHGLGGTRTMYSSVCGEFASFGLVCCAVEHRDGSGPRTYVNHMDGTVEDGDLDHSPQAREKGYDVIDYLFSEWNKYDTAPNSEKGVDAELRSAQLGLRMAEINEAYEVMREIVSGNGQSVADRNMRRKGFKGSSSHGLEDVDWSRWKDRVRLDYVTAAGHSFGAATVTEMLRGDHFPYVSQGIIYDLWGAGTRGPVAECETHKIDAPLLAINSEAFTYWPSNFDLVASLVEEAQQQPNAAPSWLMTLRGTVHVSQSDFSLLYPHVCSLALKMVANPRRALDLNLNASLEFLAHVLPPDMAQVHRAYSNEKILESRAVPLEGVPESQKHAPKQTFVAMRLRIPHEWLFRLSPRLFRSALRRRDERKGGPPENWDEVWLHVKPTKESIAEYLKTSDARSHSRAERYEAAMPKSKEDGKEAAKPVRVPSEGVPQT